MQSLIKRCIHNDKRAQLLLYERFAKTLFNSAIRILRDRMEAEDIVQDSFITAFRTLESYKQDAPFDAWIRRIVINRSLDKLRKKRPLFVELEDEQYAFNIRADEETGFPDKPDREKLEQIRREFIKLPEGYRIIFSLYYYEGFDHDEIAEITGITASTSRSQLSRARQKIINAINAGK
ncbi:MAG: sigma-70 family RNA polymerase sigma factor [Bacteroidales bacterium]|nr:sigma-70 family RNA polymerase sigma factor [Bacteroidales bacterium]